MINARLLMWHQSSENVRSKWPEAIDANAALKFGWTRVALPSTVGQTPSKTLTKLRVCKLYGLSTSPTCAARYFELLKYRATSSEQLLLVPNVVGYFLIPLRARCKGEHEGHHVLHASSGPELVSCCWLMEAWISTLDFKKQIPTGNRRAVFGMGVVNAQSRIPPSRKS